MMIYLIDDKKNRQLDYGWNTTRFKQYSAVIKPVYLANEITDEYRKEIFSEGNTILFHESFFDNTLNKRTQSAIEIRNKLNDFARNKSDFKVVYFSGSKSSRRLDGNIGHVPVSILYQNLKAYLNKTEHGENDLRYLLFGENFDIEEKLLNKLKEANNNIEDTIQIENPKSNNFIALTLQNEIDTIFDNAVYETFYLDEKYNFEITDTYLNEKIQQWFSCNEYDNIFIPLCFGPVLSDFNGLRLALHIRCTDSPSRLNNIFLYGFVDHSYLINNEYFDILKTRNVQLIDYKKTAFLKVVQTPFEPLTNDKLSFEIKKVKLNPPKNYEDNHSIANEWAIYRWSSAINAEDNDIEKIINKVNSQLYFKYLSTIYPVSKIPAISEDQLKIKYSEKPKILYIDDEAEKGWYEIFSNILFDINDLDFEYLDTELNSKTREEIINLSLDKIKEDDISLVILDFRLHPDDFNTEDIHEVTGLKLLKRIKDLNPGIQVIIFSATNKVWNLQALQDAGADGFIVKESPENSVDSNFTKQTLTKFVESVSTAFKKQFLKQFFNHIKTINYQLLECDTEDNSEFDFFIRELITQIKIIENSAINIDVHNKASFDILYLNCYNYLEKFKNFYLKEENYQFLLGVDGIEMNRYWYDRRMNSVKNEGRFIRDNRSDNPSWFQCITGLFIDYFEICNIKDKSIINLNRIKEGRNKYIHGNKKHFNENELLMIVDICKKISLNIKE